MSFKHEIARRLHEKYIAGTLPKAIVVDLTVLLCDLTIATQSELEKHVTIDGGTQRVYITTRVLKHLYDAKPAEEYDFIICNLNKIIKKPDAVYKNKNPKRGEVILTKRLNGQLYICSLEKLEQGFMAVTAFRIRKESYLSNYKLLWRWKDDTPSS